MIDLWIIDVFASAVVTHQYKLESVYTCTWNWWAAAVTEYDSSGGATQAVNLCSKLIYMLPEEE